MGISNCNPIYSHCVLNIKLLRGHSLFCIKDILLRKLLCTCYYHDAEFYRNRKCRVCSECIHFLCTHCLDDCPFDIWLLRKCLRRFRQSKNIWISYNYSCNPWVWWKQYILLQGWPRLRNYDDRKRRKKSSQETKKIIGARRERQT